MTYEDLLLSSCWSALSRIGIRTRSQKKSVWGNLFVASFSIILIVFVFWFFMRSMNKGGENINEKLLESNLEIAKELKRIADHVEKNS